MNEIGIAGKLAKAFIRSKLTPIIIAASVLIGIGAVIMLPREEEPQIIVPMIDVMVQMPGADAKEVENRVTGPLEKLLWEIPGVEYIYSRSASGMSMATVRFMVGQNEENAIVRLNQKLMSNLDVIPPGTSMPMVKARSIDDVPIMAVTLSSDTSDHFTLRRVAVQLGNTIKEINDVSDINVIGGQRRQVSVLLDQGKMASRGVAPATIVPMLQQANRKLASGTLSSENREILLETGDFLTSSDDVGSVIVGVSGGGPVYLRDVAEIIDGPEEAANYVLFGTGVGGESGEVGSVKPAVTISISKRKGTNAIALTQTIEEKIDGVKSSFVPSDVELTITRNYGETAAEKSNELLFHMLIAIASVSALILLALGIRESGIVAIAIPVTLALTLAVFYLYGYTLNRITLFALIFSIGILVDDAIVVVENVTRHFALPENKGRTMVDITIRAVDEVGNPTILATFAVIAAILPMAFVSGMMGPYMRPIPIGASAAMIFSMLVAFIVTPWASLKLLKRGASSHESHGKEGYTTRLYRKVMKRIIVEPVWRYSFLAGVVVLLLGAGSLVLLKAVKVKMLPFDNKSEFQVIIDMPEGSTLEQTTAVARELGLKLSQEPEVRNYQIYSGTASPYNFNGLVRHYFMRTGANVADIQVNLLDKGQRSAQSHDIAKRVRPVLKEIGDRYGARLKIAEVPPGPPVLQTLVAEIYGPDYERQIEVARGVMGILDSTEGVVDVDWYVEDDQKKLRFDIDRQKASLSGVTADQIVQTLRIAVDGADVGLVHLPQEEEGVFINLRLPRESRSSINDLKKISVIGVAGNLVPIGELVNITETTNEKTIYHKNLMPVVYVTADVAGVIESPVYAILDLNEQIEKMKLPEGYALERYVATQPFLTDKYAMKWDGEWHITYEVFRDLGIAFAVVLLLIYVLVVGWFQSFKTPLTIMAAIPFSLVGILPAHALAGAFFTATSMIGFIAGAGIVVRNSIILVDFIELRLKDGMPLVDAVVDAGAVRFRPMMLTAAAVIVGAGVMLMDPIFQGLAISLMAGEVASLLLSRMAVPVLFYLSERKKYITPIADDTDTRSVCAVDFSRQSGIALNYSAAVSEAMGLRLKAMTATDTGAPMYFTSDQMDRISESGKGGRSETGAMLSEFVRERLGDETQFSLEVGIGDVPSAILRSAGMSPKSLIALGTHGVGGLQKLRFGSIAETVLRSTRTNVLVVGPKVMDTGSVKIAKIVCATDLSSESAKAMEFAADLASKIGAEVSLVRVIPEYEDVDADEVEQQLCDWVPTETRERCSVTEIVRRGDVAAELANELVTQGADLLIIGVSHGIFSDETLGESTRNIILESRKPVLVVTPDE
jgi:multidrug efflux pump subunit AcrB/nucleotide-binding universal stress UspA family protein